MSGVEALQLLFLHGALHMAVVSLCSTRIVTRCVKYSEAYAYTTGGNRSVLHSRIAGHLRCIFRSKGVYVN